VQTLPFVVNSGSFNLSLSKYVGSDMQTRLLSGVQSLLTSSPHAFASAYGNTKGLALSGNAALAQALKGVATPSGFPLTDLGGNYSLSPKLCRLHQHWESTAKHSSAP